MKAATMAPDREAIAEALREHDRENEQNIAELSKSFEGWKAVWEVHRTALVDSVGTIHTRLDKFEKVLLTGNGEQSIVTRLALIEKGCLRHRENQVDAKQGRYAFWGSIIVAVLSGIFALVMFFGQQSPSGDDHHHSNTVQTPASQP